MKIKFLAISFIIFAVPFFISIEAKANQILDAKDRADLEISDKRLIDWDAGVRGGIPNVPTKVNIVNAHGAVPNDGQDDSRALRDAINDCAGQIPCAIYLPAGNYHIRGRFNIPSGVVIRGEYDHQKQEHKTHLLVTPLGSGDNTGNRHTFVAAGTKGKKVNLSLRAEAGTKTIKLNSLNDSFVIGKFVEIMMDNDDNMLGLEFGITRGQILKIIARNEQTNELTLDVPLRLTYPLTKNPRIYPLNPKENIGFEDFHIKHISSDDDKSIMFRFHIAVNSWVKNVDSEKAAKNHIHLGTSRFITVKDSVIHEAHTYGTGGYGIYTGEEHTSDCLVINNTLYKLRHSLLINASGNGNVFAYNYSTDLYANEGISANKGLTDASFHGNYGYMNLFEGNVVQWFHIGDWWGPSGPYNTLFRNRAIRAPYSSPNSNPPSYRAGIKINCTGNPCTDYQNMIGNTSRGRIENANGFANDDNYDDDYSKNLWIEKNIICHGGFEGDFNGSDLIENIEADNVGSCTQRAIWKLPSSLYFSEEPDFLQNFDWPMIGADVDSQRLSDKVPFENLPKIPAQIRYEKIMGIYEEPTITPIIGPQCLNIQIFDNNGQVIGVDQTINKNEQIRFECQTDPLTSQTIKFRIIEPDSEEYDLTKLNSNINDHFSDLYLAEDYGDFIVQCAVCDIEGNNCAWE